MPGDTGKITILLYFVSFCLKGELDYEIQENDNITFISTLHGG